MTQFSSEGSVYLIRYGDLPDQINRAVYQRPAFLARHTRMHLITSRGSKVCKAIRENAEIHEIPCAWLRHFSILGVTVWNAFAAVYTALMLWRTSGITLYVFHRNGFTAGGFLKLLRGSAVRLVCDMQHTPYRYLDSASAPSLGRFKRLVYSVIGRLHVSVARLVLPRADLVCAMSLDYGEGFAAIMENDFGVSPERLLPIPNGADLELAKQDPSEASLLPIKTAMGTHFLYAGNLQTERLEFLLRVFRAYVNLETTSRFTICGTITPEARSLLKRISMPGVDHIGRVPHSKLMRLYREVDVVLVIIEASRRDHKFSHPGKLFEAMSMRKLVMASDFALAERIIEHKRNGFLVTRQSIEIACRDLYNAVREPELRRSIEAAASKSLELFDWKVLNIRWFTRLQGILSQSDHPLPALS